MEVKAAHQFVKFALKDVNVKKNKATITIYNDYDFTLLSDFNLVYEVVKEGRVVATRTVKLPATKPSEECKLTLKLPKAALKNAKKEGVETMLNLHLVRRAATTYSEAGHEEALAQFTLVERGKLPVVEAKGEPILATSSLHEVMVGTIRCRPPLMPRRAASLHWLSRAATSLPMVKVSSMITIAGLRMTAMATLQMALMPRVLSR